MIAVDVITDREYIEIVVDFNALNVSIQGTVPEEVFGPFANLAALAAAYPKLYKDVHRQYLGEFDEIYDQQPMDVLAEGERAARRQKLEETLDNAEWEAKMEQIQALLADFSDEKGTRRRLDKYYRKRDDIDLSGEALGESFQYALAIDRHDAPVPLGGSKKGGLPHLPAGMEWPTLNGEPMYLLVQLKLSELAEADISGWLPGAGTAYLFITETASGVLLHTMSTELEVREVPHEVPDYMKRLVEQEVALSFRPAFYFDQTSDTGGPNAIWKALPSDFKDTLVKALGCPMFEDAHFYGGDRVLGGEPIDWQAMGESYVKHEVFVQLEHDEGHVTVGVHPLDLRAGCFEDADVGYCGT